MKMSQFAQLGEHQYLNSALLHPLSFWLLSFSCLLFLIKIFSTSNPKKNLPPSPPKLPLIGNLHQLGHYPQVALRALAQRYGPLMLLRFGTRPVLVVSSADAAREVLKTNDAAFSNRPKTVFFEKFLRKDMIASPYGEHWRHLRGICVIQLLSNKRVDTFRSVRKEEIGLMVEKIKSSMETTSSANLSEILLTLTNGVVCRTALGRRCIGEEDGKKFEEMLTEAVEMFSHINVADYIPWLAWINKLNGFDAKMKRVFRAFDDFLEAVIQEHLDREKREGGGNESRVLEGDQAAPKDFVDALLEIQKEEKASNKTGSTIDRDSIKCLILDVFNAGTETTSATLEWGMTTILKNPEVMEKLQNEVRGITGDKNEVTEEELEKMQYLKAVIKEIFRMHPPIGLFLRESRQNVNVKGYDIATGTMVLTNTWAIGRDPSIWEEPEEFRPERFLNSSTDFRGQYFELIPFGAGRRSCPGISYANAIVEIAIATLMHKFDWKLCSAPGGKDLSEAEGSGLIGHKKFPLLAVATPHAAR